MSNAHENDDEIRESIPCVTLLVPETSVSEAHTLCLPVGYALERGAVWWRGCRLEGVAPGELGAWTHAVAREKARRQRDGQVTAADKATAMLAEVIRERDAANALAEALRLECETAIRERWQMRQERDELRATLEAERSTRKATIMFELYRERDALKADLARAVQWRDAMREKLGRVRLLTERQEIIYSHDIEAIIGEETT